MLSLNRKDFKERAGVGDARKRLTLCDPVFFTTLRQRNRKEVVQQAVLL